MAEKKTIIGEIIKQTGNGVKSRIELDDEFETIETVPGLKTDLYPHQKTTVAAMIELENTRTFTSGDINIEYSTSILSEPVGSGKTIDLLAVICLSKKPRIIPDITVSNFYSENNHISSYNCGYVRRTFDVVLSPTVIFVGSSVMKQWEQAIKTFTSLSHFSVTNIYELNKLMALISNGKVNSYDIILIKNGTVKNGELKDKNRIILPYGLKPLQYNFRKIAFMYNIIANINSITWARVIIDDYDVIKLPGHTTVNAVFTWYVSSTMNNAGTDNTKIHHTHFKTASEWIRDKTNPYDPLYASTSRWLNVRNKAEFIENSFAIPHPNFYITRFVNKANAMIETIGQIGQLLNNKELMGMTEMLNGDAFDQAASTIGIKSNSVADIFEKILGDNYEKYRFAGDLLEFIEYNQANKEARMPFNKNLHQEQTSYGKKRLLEFEDILYDYPGIDALLELTHAEYTEIKRITGVVIDRVKDNLRHGECPICFCNINEETSPSIMITKCCKIILCLDCSLSMRGITTGHNIPCPNCRHPLNIKNMIYIGHDIKLANITDEIFEEPKEEVEEATDSKDAKQDEKQDKKPEAKPEDYTKFSAMLDVINGKAVTDAKKVTMHINNMVEGTTTMREATTRKVLIFANYEDTLTKVLEKLNTEKITHWKLHGTAKDIALGAKAFTEHPGPCVLLINSAKHCSGLNLQTATDIIFMHYIVNQSVESQVIGRGQRIGRKSPLNIHYMLYENEYLTMLNTTAVEIPDDEDDE